jgi:hypothetical protein
MLQWKTRWTMLLVIAIVIAIAFIAGFEEFSRFAFLEW